METGVELPDWVVEQRVPATTATGIRRAVGEDLIRAAGTTVGYYHGVGFIDGEPCVVGGMAFGNEALMDHLSRFESRPFREWADVDTALTTTLNSFDETTDDQVRTNKLYRMAWEPMRCKSVVAMTAVVGGEVVGWVAAHRLIGEDYFGEELVRALNKRASAYIHALEVAHRLDGHAHASRAIIVTDATGEPQYSCEQGAGWLADSTFATRLAELVRSSQGKPLTPRALGGALVRLSRVRGDEGELYCAEVSELTTWTPHKISYLSTRKRQIAQLAAFGATNAEIARSLDVSPDTVRSHMRQIFDELEISSRIELAHAVHSALQAPATA